MMGRVRVCFDAVLVWVVFHPQWDVWVVCPPQWDVVVFCTPLWVCLQRILDRVVWVVVLPVVGERASYPHRLCCSPMQRWWSFPHRLCYSRAGVPWLFLHQCWDLVQWLFPHQCWGPVQGGPVPGMRVVVVVWTRGPHCWTASKRVTHTRADGHRPKHLSSRRCRACHPKCPNHHHHHPTKRYSPCSLAIAFFANSSCV